jgi:CheY-like chemotaxis protein
VEIIISIEPDVPQLLRGDPDRLRQVFANLIGNAVKFTDHGEIVLRVSKLSESPCEATLRFEVRDTGIGIPAQVLPHLFDPFIQAEGTARQFGGTGLGLAIVRQLVEQMGGTIGVVSAPGAGSTFWLTIKLARQPAAVKKAPSARLGLENVHALIVDDNPLNRAALKSQLLAWKMAPDTAANPAQALEMMRREADHGHPYALILLDMEMPEMTGIELARKVLREPEIANTPLAILSSAPKTPDIPGLAAQLDIRGFLLKPFRQTELLDCIADALNRSSPLDRRLSETTQGSNEASIIEPIVLPGGGNPRVLLVEDNAANREVGLWQLQKLGCVADIATNGHEALEAATKTAYNVILMDCRMPNMDGYGHPPHPSARGSHPA